MAANPDEPVVITRDDLTRVIREQGQCTCPLPKVDPSCPRHGAAGTELPMAERVERLKVNPGDALVITYAQKLPMVVVDRVRNGVLAQLGQDMPVVILDDGARLQVAEGEALARVRYPETRPGKVIAYQVGGRVYPPEDVIVVREAI